MTDKIIELALKRFKFTSDSEYENRTEMKSDTEFYVSDQWDSGIKTDRLGDSRPCLTINLLPSKVRQVTNAMKQNKSSVKIIPANDGDEEVAEIFNGIIRHIQEASQANVAYSTATDAQVRSGLGYYRIITEYCNDKTFDQDIRIKRIKNALNVYFDPAAIEPDYSDAMYAFIVSDITHEEFKEQYPDKQILSSDTLSSYGDERMDWAKKDSMRIAEYFTVEEEDDGEIHLLPDGTVTKDIPDGIEPINSRKITKKSIKWRIISGVEVLEEKDWAGKYIPIVPVIGEDIDVDGSRIVKGMVRDAKDPQRMYNYWNSAQTEMIALAPKAPFIIAEGQLEGYKDIWQNANTKNYAYLPYNPTSIGGTLIGAPQRQIAEPPVQAMVQALKQASEDMKAVTGIYDASLGARSNEVSGKAIKARTMQGDISNYHFTDGFENAQFYEGKILLDLIPKIYDGARIARILHEDGTAEYKKINQPSDDKDENGIAKIYDLTVGEYGIVITTGPSYKTKREEDAASMAQVLQGNPELWQVAGDLMVKAMDWPDADQLAERLRKMLPPQLQEQDGEQPIPPQIKQQLDQYGQMVEQLTSKLHELQNEKDTKKQELESKERIALEQINAEITLKAMDLEGNAAHSLLLAELKGVNDRLQLININQPIDGDNPPATPAAQASPPIPQENNVNS